MELKKKTTRGVFESLFESSSRRLTEICRAASKEKMSWQLPNGDIQAICFQSAEIPKAGLSILKQEDNNEATYRVGLNIYIQNPRIPDGSFAVLLSKQQDFSFIGGVIELFPAITIKSDIEGFKNEMRKVAHTYGHDYEACRKGLVGAFTLKNENESLGAEAGFNFYRSGLDATPQNLMFANEAFLSALDAYKSIVEKRRQETITPSLPPKEPFWRKHLEYMQEDDVGIKMSIEMGIPLEFFEFSAFPPSKMNEIGLKSPYDL